MWRFELKNPSDRTPVALGGLTAFIEQSPSTTALERFAVRVGNRSYAIADVFRLRFEATELSAAGPSVRFEGDCRALFGVGQGMSRGTWVVEGSVGGRAGEAMSGGRLEIGGDASDGLGLAMKGGVVRVQGNAGSNAGGANPGAKVGMLGGELLIAGAVGAGVGTCMRRGLIAIGGSAPDYVGRRMAAGSIFLFGSLGLHPGAGMKRGSIVCCEPTENSSACGLGLNFRLDGRMRLGWVDLYFRRLQQLGFAPATRSAPQRFHKFRGDFLTLGKGEVLFAAD